MRVHGGLRIQLGKPSKTPRTILQLVANMPYYCKLRLLLPALLHILRHWHQARKRKSR